MKHVIEFVSPADYGDVRNRKVARYLKSRGFSLSFVGWDRGKKSADSDLFESIKYILKGGGECNKVTPLYYCMFIIKVFIRYLFVDKNVSKKLLYAVNFEAAFAIWLASKFRKVNYTYDIWDELALSHSFPKMIKNFIRFFDKKIRKSAVFYIHVDTNRVSDIDNSNYVIVYNSPYDYYKKQQPEYSLENSFAVTGYFSNVRGLESILEFAKNNKDIKFIVIGEFLNKNTEREYLNTPNVEYYHFMPQEQLFEKIRNCRGIFSLYDPKLEINQLAASNKLYDAMMLGIPAIVNNEIKTAHFVKNKNIGFCVNYVYDDSWQALVNNDKNIFVTKGQNGRTLYEQNYEFATMSDKSILPKLIDFFNMSLNNSQLPPPQRHYTKQQIQ